MNLDPDRLITGHRLGCAALTYLAEPGHPLLGPLLRVLDPSGVLASITSGIIPADAAGALGDARAARLRPALASWRAQLPRTGIAAELARHAARGIRWSAPATPNGRPGWMTWAPTGRTACGCAAPPTYGPAHPRPACRLRHQRGRRHRRPACRRRRRLARGCQARPAAASPRSQPIRKRSPAGHRRLPCAEITFSTTTTARPPTPATTAPSGAAAE